MDEPIQTSRCVTEDGKHDLVEAEFPFWLQCRNCFERYILVSETSAKEAGLEFVERKNNT